MEREHDPGKDLLTPVAARRLIGVSERTLLRYVEQGLLNPVMTPGGHRRYLRSELDGILSRPSERAS